MEDKVKELEEKVEAAPTIREKIFALHQLAWTVKYSDLKRALTLQEEALIFSRSVNDKALIANSLSGLGVFYIIASDYQNALTTLLKAEKIFGELGGIQGLSKVFSRLGVLYNMLGDYPRALDALFQGLKLTPKNDDRRDEAICYANIANVYENLKDHNKALEYKLITVKIFENLGDNFSLGQLMINIGNSYRYLYQFKNALDYFFEALSIFEHSENEFQKAIALNNIGMTYRDMGKFSESLEFSKKALEIKRRIKDKYGIIVTLQQIGNVYFDQKDYQASIPLFAEALRLAENIESKVQIYQICLALADSYQEIGEYKKALIFYERFHTVKEEIFNEESSTKAKNLQIIHETEIYRLKSERLEKELQIKDKELARIAFFLSQQNDFLIRLQDQISEQKNKKSDDECKILLKSIKRQIKENIGLSKKENWTTFEERFNDVHPNFMQNLALKYPQLTPSELRVCILLKINLTSKQIAQALNLAYKTIEVHRRNIRKKMELPPDANLTTHVIALK